MKVWVVTVNSYYGDANGVGQTSVFAVRTSKAKANEVAQYERECNAGRSNSRYDVDGPFEVE